MKNLKRKQQGYSPPPFLFELRKKEMESRARDQIKLNNIFNRIKDDSLPFPNLLEKDMGFHKTIVDLVKIIAVKSIEHPKTIFHLLYRSFINPVTLKKYYKINNETRKSVVSQLSEKERAMILSFILVKFKDSDTKKFFQAKSYLLSDPNKKEK